MEKTGANNQQYTAADNGTGIEVQALSLLFFF